MYGYWKQFCICDKYQNLVHIYIFKCEKFKDAAAATFADQSHNIGLDKHIFERKIVNIILPIFIICFGCSKEPPRGGFFSTHNICFG